MGCTSSLNRQLDRIDDLLSESPAAALESLDSIDLSSEQSPRIKARHEAELARLEDVLIQTEALLRQTADEREDYKAKYIAKFKGQFVTLRHMTEDYLATPGRSDQKEYVFRKVAEEVPAGLRDLTDRVSSQTGVSRFPYIIASLFVAANTLISTRFARVVRFFFSAPNAPRSNLLDIKAL